MVDVATRPGSLNFISLCTGGGGLDLGVELAIPGARAVCMVEREAYAVSALVEAMQQGSMAPAPIWSNVGTFRGRPWRGVVDFVIGGIPCQPHSLAGKKLGKNDERDLWSEARRVIVQSGAWGVLIENVGGMLSSGGAERVHRDLRRLGFSVEAGLFTAAECGAPQDRERLFILAVANSVSGGCYVGEADQIWTPQQRAIIARPGEDPLFPPGPNEVDEWTTFLGKRADLKPMVRGGPDGMARRVERLRMLGNGVVPVEGAYALRYLATSLAHQGSRSASRLVRMMEV